MADSIEAVNEQIAFLTAGMTKSEPVGQFGATVTTYTKQGAEEPALEITVYEPGTPIDSEHASLLDEAPDMTKLLHGDAEDLTTTRVLVLDLADGVDGGDELQTEAERSQFGLGVTSFVQDHLDSNPDAGEQLRQTYVDESGQTQPVAKIDFTPDEGALMVDGKISGTANVSIPATLGEFIGQQAAARQEAKAEILGKDASTHPFDGVVSDTVVDPDLMANYKYAVPLTPPGPDTPTRLYTDAQGVNRISDVAMTPADRAASIAGKDAIDKSKTLPFSSDVYDGDVVAHPMPTEAEIEAQDPLGQEEDDEGGCAI